jgi:hypothetical protein
MKVNTEEVNYLEKKFKKFNQGMEKTITKIKTLKNRRKLSLPASPKLFNAEDPRRRDSECLGGHADQDEASVGSSGLVIPRSRLRSLSPSEELFRRPHIPKTPSKSKESPSKSSSKDINKIQRKVGWSPALRRNSRTTLIHSEEDEQTGADSSPGTDSPTDLTTEKLQAMRKSLRSRSVCSSAGPASGSGGPPTPGNYSLMAGLLGVNSFVNVTGSHISGRRLSTPVGSDQQRPSAVERPASSAFSKATHRSKRSESASTVEEEALKLRAYMAGRHGSLPMVVVNSNFYPQTGQSKFLCPAVESTNFVATLDSSLL